MEKPEENLVEKIEFKCEKCSLHEFVDYFGKNPPFSGIVEFKHDCYVMKDPFSPQPSRLSNRSYSQNFIVIGAHCVICGIQICKDPACGVYYLNQFCLDCAFSNIKKFPVEIQTKIKKEVVGLRDGV